MEANYFGLAATAQIKARPQDFIVTDEIVVKVEQTAKKVREARDLANPPKPQNAYDEYRQLRGRLNQLERGVENSVIYFTNIEGNVAQLQQNLKDAEQRKNQALKVGNNRFEKNVDHTISRLKVDLADAQKELKAAKANKEGAAETLEAFDQHERIAELKEQLGL